MAFKKVSGARKYFKYAECEPGQKLVDGGIYIGPEEGRFGVQHVFRQIGDDTIVVLNSAGHLNYLLEEHSALGKLCNVFYADKVMLTKGAFRGKEAHNFDLEIDLDYGITSQTPSKTPVRHSAQEGVTMVAGLSELVGAGGQEDISL